MRMHGEPRRRGDPLLVLALMLGLWVLSRAAAWSIWPEFAPSVPAAIPVFAPIAGPKTTAGAGQDQPPLEVSWQTSASPWPPKIDRTPEPTPPSPEPLPLAPAPITLASRPAMPPVSPQLAGGHAMLWLAAVAHLPAPVALLEAAGPPAMAGGPRVPLLAPASPAPHRWSADAWAMLRPGSGGTGAAAFGPTYGASQAGAVLRYRLAPTNSHRPTLYLRAEAALAVGDDREVAAGLALRPIAKLPVAVGGEARVTRIGLATVVRPAVLAVTELSAFDVGYRVRGEVYVQGGYVGGRAATAFLDGSVRLDRHVAAIGRAELRAGGGAWGGAQKGAARLDIGPTATLGFAAGSASARLALDWRQRVAGDAAPWSGPAITISAGF